MKAFNILSLLAAVPLHLPWCLGHAVAPAPTAPTVQGTLNERGDDNSVRFACDYLTSNPKYNTAANHHNLNCRIDPARGLWGVCGAGIDRIEDCGIAGACIDDLGCKNGCGSTGQSGVTFTCSENTQCSSAFLFYGGRDYKYIGCGTTDQVNSYTLSLARSTDATPTASGTPKNTGRPLVSTKTSATNATVMETIGAFVSKATGTSQSFTESAGSLKTATTSENDKVSAKNFDLKAAIIGATVGGAALLALGIAAGCVLYSRQRSEWNASTHMKQVESVVDKVLRRRDVGRSHPPTVTTSQQADTSQSGFVASGSPTRYELPG